MVPHSPHLSVFVCSVWPDVRSTIGILPETFAAKGASPDVRRDESSRPERSDSAPESFRPKVLALAARAACPELAGCDAAEAAEVAP
jgi:hypothetical protein